MTTLVTKAVFDTNILVSGHFWKGPPYRCLIAVEAGLVSLVLSDSITSELREKLTEKFEVPAAEVDAIIDPPQGTCGRCPRTGPFRLGEAGSRR